MSETRWDEMEATAWAFHKRRPEVWELFHRFTMEKVNRGFKNYGAKSIMERIRWETDTVADAPDQFKLGNNVTAFYARWWMNANPEHEGFFRLRKQISAAKPATNRPELGPSDMDYLN